MVLEEMDRTPMQCIAAKSLLGLGCSHHGFVVKEGGRFKSSMSLLFLNHSVVFI